MPTILLHLGTDGGRITPAIAATIKAARLDGAVWTGHWKSMETAPGAFNFWPIEQFLSDCERYGIKTRGLRLYGGGQHAPAWATDGSPIATVGDPQYVVPWAAPLYTDRLLRFLEKLGQYGRYFQYLQPPIGVNQAEMILPDSKAPDDANVTVWHRPDLWDPKGQAEDRYTVARHAAWVLDVVEHCLDTWPDTILQIMVNRQAFDDEGRRTWTRLTGNPPAVAHPAEKAAAAVLDGRNALSPELAARVIPGWTWAEQPLLTEDQQRLLDQIAYYCGGEPTCFDFGRPETASDVQAMYRAMRAYGAEVVRVGPQDVERCGTEVFAGLER